MTLYNYIQEITNPDYLSAYDCEAIFNLLVNQNHVLGGKIWTTDDIKTRLQEHTNRIMTEEEENTFIEKVKKHIDPFMLNEATEGEWNAIDTAILDTLSETNS